MIIDAARAPREHGENGGTIIYLSEAAGITQFGAYVDTLMPGGISSERHWHSAEDEFLYVLTGTVTMIDDDGEHSLGPGDAACWRHGDPNAHHLHNQSPDAVTYLIVGSRVARDICHYPDTGERLVNGDKTWHVYDRSGEIVDEGDLGPHLLNLKPRWGKDFDPSNPARRVLRNGSVAAITTADSSDSLDNLGIYHAFPLSDEGGLTQFGAFTETLMPGAQSSQRHWHEDEDEFALVLQGTVTLIENDGPHLLQPVDAAAWPAGLANGHCLRNLTDQPVTYLVVGSRLPQDTVHYPDIDRHYVRKDGLRQLTYKDGTPIPGWPKPSNR